MRDNMCCTMCLADKLAVRLCIQNTTVINNDGSKNDDVKRKIDNKINRHNGRKKFGLKINLGRT